MNNNNDTVGSSQNQDKMTEDLDKETDKVSSSAPDRRKVCNICLKSNIFSERRFFLLHILVFLSNLEFGFEFTSLFHVKKYQRFNAYDFDRHTRDCL